MLESLRHGDLGQLTADNIDDYRAQCHTIFPHANAFILELPNGTVDEILADSDTAAANTVDAADCIDCLP